MKTLKLLFAAGFALLAGASALAAAPAAPTGVTATTNCTGYIYLNWPKVADAAYYVVYRYAGNTEQTGLEQFTTKGLSYTDTSCEAGMTIPYRVRAFNAAGEGSKYSAYVRGFRKVLLEPFVGGECSVNPLGNAGVAQPLQVRCNYRWQATAADDWIRLHIAAFERSNDATNLLFSLAKNDTGAPRTGTISLKAGRETATLKVVQGAVEVPGYPSWCGDSQYAIVEDAAAPETFTFMTPWPASFVSVPDDTAVGGSCLRSMPVTTGQCAVVAWSLPENWRLRFRWRKDTANANDRFTLSYGNLVNGKPDIVHSTDLATCTSTEWTTVELDQDAATTNLFFVYWKYPGGTASTDAGFAYLDDFLVQTAPQSIRFLDPPVKYSAETGKYTLYLPTFGSRTVATEVTFGHTVTLGGEMRQATGLVYPVWEKLLDYRNLKINPGTGADAHLTTFTYDAEGTGSVGVRASYTIGTATAQEVMTVNYLPSSFRGLDTEYNSCALTEGDIPCEWIYQEDVTAFLGTSVWSGELTGADSRTFSARFSGNQLLRFSYKVASLAADESFTMTIDGLEIVPELIADGDWHVLRLSVPTNGDHELEWKFVKTGSAPSGGGVWLDNADFEGPSTPTPGDAMMLRSAVFDNTAQAFAPIYVAASPDAFTVEAVRGGDWITTAAQVGGYAVLAFDVAANETGSFRAGRIRYVNGTATNYISVVQSGTASAEVAGLEIWPNNGFDALDCVSGDSVPFSASFTLGGEQVVMSPDLDFYFEEELLEDGVLVVPELGDVLDCVNVSVDLGVNSRGRWYRTSCGLALHPSPAKLMPAGVTFGFADGWWVEKDSDSGELYLQTDTIGDASTTKSLAMTVTGPGVFTCQGKAIRTTIGFYVDGVRDGGVSGSEWSDDLPVVVPEGEHELRLDYVKQDEAGTYADVGAIRRISWTPLAYTGVTLDGPAAMTSGGRELYALVKHYTNTTLNVGADLLLKLTWEAEQTVTALDPRTTELISGGVVKTAIADDQVALRVPLAMSWNDTLTLTVTADDNGTPCTASKEIAVTATALTDVLDNSLPGLSVPYKSSDYVHASVASDSTAVGGTCLDLTSEVYYETSDLQLTVMDKGTLTFNYKLIGGDPSLTVYVDGVPYTNITENATEWTPTTVTVDGFGPHVITWSVVRGFSLAVSGFIDNVQWTQGERGTVTGAEVYQASDYGYAQTYRFRIAETVGVGAASTTEYYDLTPDTWNMELVSGDGEAAAINPNGDFCEVWLSGTILQRTTCRLSASCCFAGVSYAGETNLVFEPRVSVEDAIFDSGRYESCTYSWADGWSGTFEDHTVGTSCAKTDAATQGETRTISVECIGKGTLTFDWKTAGAAGNTLAFCTRVWDKVAMTEIVTTNAVITSPSAGWQQASVVFGDDEEFDADGRPKTHDCYIEYVQNGDNATGTDFGFVDNVTWSGTTPLPIEYGQVTVSSDALAPGESATAAVVFYRRSGGQGVPMPATGSDVPTVTDWSVINCEPSGLSGYVHVTSDPLTGNATVSVDANCPYAGSCVLLPSYTLYGKKNDGTVGYLSVTAPVKASSAPRTMASLSAATLSAPAMKRMAANGINTVGQCLVAGIPEDDKDAKFTVSVTMTNGVPYITWDPNLPDREYVIMGKTNLTDAAWVAPTNSAHRFFNVKIVTE